MHQIQVNEQWCLVHKQMTLLNRLFSMNQSKICSIFIYIKIIYLSIYLDLFQWIKMFLIDLVYNNNPCSQTSISATVNLWTACVYVMCTLNQKEIQSKCMKWLSVNTHLKFNQSQSLVLSIPTLPISKSLYWTMSCELQAAAFSHTEHCGIYLMKSSVFAVCYNHIHSFGIDQGCPNSVLEGRCPAEFSSNLPQHTCLEASSMPSKTLISCFRCV